MTPPLVSSPSLRTTNTHFKFQTVFLLCECAFTLYHQHMICGKANLLSFFAGFSLLMLGACSGAPSSEFTMPTRANLPTVTHTPAPVIMTEVMQQPTLPPTHTATVAPTATDTPTPTVTATSTASATPTATYTNTPTPTNTLTPSNTPPVGNASVINPEGVNLRTGPGRSHPPVSLLEAGTEMTIIGRTPDSSWLEIRTFDRRGGWVFAELVDVRVSVADVPVRGQGGIVTSVTLLDEPPDVPSADTAYVPGLTLSNRVLEIFEAGQAMGNRARVFSKVGDSITATQPSLIGFGNGNYDLGAYAYLQPTIDFFSVSPRPELANSFSNRSFAAKGGFNTATLLTPTRADPQHCHAGESPLPCEYRIVRPAVAVIMLGSVDVQVYGVDEFRRAMQGVVDYSIEQGVIPVLTTFPSREEFEWSDSLAFNQVIREIAEAEQVPLIDFWRISRGMPNYGLDADHFHLSWRGNDYIDFNGEQHQYGLTMRSLLTLQTLDILRRDVLTR